MNKIEFGDCREIMKKWIAEGVKVQTCVTSPPYFGLRDYGVEGQLGLEQTPAEYVINLVEVFRSVRDLLTDDGTLWLNLGDSYAGSWGAQSRGNTTGEAKSRLQGSSMLDARRILAHPLGKTCTGSLKNTPGLKPKDLIGIPWHVAFALQADGWYLRQDIIWQKPNCMPRPDKDRCVTSHEYIFLLSKSKKYYFDYKAIQEPAAQPNRIRADRFGGNKHTGDTTMHSDGSVFTGSTVRNRRSVWTVTTKPYKGAHFATFPADLIEPCVLAGSRIGDIVFDPFMGSGTTAQVALQHGRQYLGCELNRDYEVLQNKRLSI